PYTTLFRSELAGSSLTMFELMEKTPLDFVLRHVPGTANPLAEESPWYVLIEVSSGRSAEDASEMMTSILSIAYEEELLSDATIAQSEAQRTRLLHLREDMSDAQKPEGASIKHDISVPVVAIPEFIERAGIAVQQVVPGARVACFGHMGDGNLHYNVSQPVGADAAAYLTHYRAMNDAVYAIVRDLGGSSSAEHGIGSLKRDALIATQPAIATDLMRRIKAAFDPAGIMNPGKMI